MKNFAFTMAEILLSLTIIGVVAAITLPSLTGNINERTWNTQRKALYARMSQAIALMPALNGYGTTSEGTDSSAPVDTAAETFVTGGLSKVLKINNICDNEHLEDCGVPTSITNMVGTRINTPAKLSDLNQLNVNVVNGNVQGGSYVQFDTKAAAFETANGETILAYYNPSCRGSLNTTTTTQFQPMMCANFVYDLNGSKGPNTVGKDIGFMSVFYPSDPKLVAPYPYQRDLPEKHNYTTANSACTKEDPEYRAPSVEEMASIFTNRVLVSDNVHIDPSGTIYTTTTLVASPQGKKIWYFCTDVGYANTWQSLTGQFAVRCVKR